MLHSLVLTFVAAVPTSAPTEWLAFPGAVIDLVAQRVYVNAAAEPDEPLAMRAWSSQDPRGGAFVEGRAIVARDLRSGRLLWRRAGVSSPLYMYRGRLLAYAQDHPASGEEVVLAILDAATGRLEEPLALGIGVPRMPGLGAPCGPTKRAHIELRGRDHLFEVALVVSECSGGPGRGVRETGDEPRPPRCTSHGPRLRLDLRTRTVTPPSQAVEPAPPLPQQTPVRTLDTSWALPSLTAPRQPLDATLSDHGRLDARPSADGAHVIVFTQESSSGVIYRFVDRRDPQKIQTFTFAHGLVPHLLVGPTVIATRVGELLGVDAKSGAVRWVHQTPALPATELPCPSAPLSR